MSQLDRIGFGAPLQANSDTMKPGCIAGRPKDSAGCLHMMGDTASPESGGIRHISRHLSCALVTSSNSGVRNMAL